MCLEVDKVLLAPPWNKQFAVDGDLEAQISAFGGVAEICCGGPLAGGVQFASPKGGSGECASWFLKAHPSMRYYIP